MGRVGWALKWLLFKYHMREKFEESVHIHNQTEDSGQRNTKIPLASTANTFLSFQTCFCCKIDFRLRLKVQRSWQTVWEAGPWSTSLLPGGPRDSLVSSASRRSRRKRGEREREEGKEAGKLSGAEKEEVKASI